MKVYLSNPYGTIPGEKWREYRFLLLAKALELKGHEVVWFTSTFSHHFKIERSKESKIISISDNFKIHLIKSRPYSKNLSFGRIFRDLTYGFNLMETLKNDYPCPGVFFVGDSPVLFYYPSYWYCRKNNIPYIVDQMDLWPELIVKSFPARIRPFVEIFCFPIYQIRKKVFNNCFGFISLAKKYLDIPMSISTSIVNKPNAVIYNGIDVDEFRLQMTIVDPSIDKKLGNKSIGEIWFIFAGTLGPSYDLETMLHGFLNLNDKCKLIIAGDGSERTYVENFIKENELNNVKYIGKISKNSLPYLYSKCDIGLNTYGVYSNVEMSDKFYDYTGAGLVVLNSLQGEVKDFVEKFGIGYNYQASNLESFIDKLQLIINSDNLALMKEKSFELGSFFDQKKQMNKFSQFMDLVERSLMLKYKS